MISGLREELAARQIILLGGDWNHGILNDFPYQLGISSSQLTNSYFSEGLKPPTSIHNYIILYIYIYTLVISV